MPFCPIDDKSVFALVIYVGAASQQGIIGNRFDHDLWHQVSSPGTNELKSVIFL